jgi:tRNA(fMet)-specific endonuclease VapC
VRYILDTNTVVYFFKGQGRVAERLTAVPPSAVALPSVVLFELETGIAKSSDPGPRRVFLDRFLRAVRVLPFDASAARAAARTRAELEVRGAPIGPMDTLIAGTALSVGGALVTRNLRAFGRVPGLDVVDWFE